MQALSELSEIDGREPGPPRNAGVVHEQVNLRMPFDHPRGDRLHVVAAADVAELVLGAQLLRERAQPVLPPRQQDELPAAGSELARDRRAEAARGPPADPSTPHRQTPRRPSPA